MGNRRLRWWNVASANRLCGRPAITWRWALSSTCTWLWYGQSWSKVHQIDINRLCSWHPTDWSLKCRGCRGCRGRLTNRRLAGTGRTHTILEVGDQWSQQVWLTCSRLKLLGGEDAEHNSKVVNSIHNNTWYFMIFREGRRRALSSREPWNRGNRTVHGFHGSTAHGSTVQPWNRAAVEPCGHGWYGHG